MTDHLKRQKATEAATWVLDVGQSGLQEFALAERYIALIIKDGVRPDIRLYPSTSTYRTLVVGNGELPDVYGDYIQFQHCLEEFFDDEEDEAEVKEAIDGIADVTSAVRDGTYRGTALNEVAPDDYETYFFVHPVMADYLEMGDSLTSDDPLEWDDEWTDRLTQEKQQELLDSGVSNLDLPEPLDTADRGRIRWKYNPSD